MLNIEQVCTLLNISRTCFYNRRKQKAFPVYMIGTKPCCKYDEIMWYLEKVKE